MLVLLGCLGIEELFFGALLLSSLLLDLSLQLVEQFFELGRIADAVELLELLHVRDLVFEKGAVKDGVFKDAVEEERPDQIVVDVDWLVQHARRIVRNSARLRADCGVVERVE